MATKKKPSPVADVSQVAALQALVELTRKNPEAAREALLANKGLLEELQELNRRYDAGERVSLEGFKLYYKEIYLRELPYVQEPIVSEFVEAYYKKSGVMEECWRGFGKSTLLVAWVSYLVGARPVGSTSYVRINDTKAKEAGDAIAEIIETNPGWNKIFPHVVPDKEAGWSVERGFHVKDMRVVNTEGYNKWLQLCFADHLTEPSLACGGVESGIIIGSHPTNGWWFDDLLDESNTRSFAEMQKVTDIMDGNIIPTWFGVGGSPTLGGACTPWRDDDVYVRLMKTGLFKKVQLPIFVREVPEVHPAKAVWERNLKKYGKVRFKPYGYDVILTYPEAFPINRVEDMYKSNPARFGQMYLVDITTLKGLTLKRETLGEYPADKISDSWACFFGVDFASTTDKIKKDTDYFSVSIGRILPQGGVVCTGGYIDRLSMAEATAKLQALYEMYHPVIIGVEKLGGGRQFIEALLQSTRLPVLGLPLEGTPLKSKGQKFEDVLNSLFSTGRMWISSVHDLYLNTFIDQWISWDGGTEKSRTGHDDALDSMYLLSLAAQGHVMQAPQPGVEPYKRRVSKGLLSGMSSHKGY